MCITVNSAFHEWMKHLDVDYYHLVQEKAQVSLMTLLPLSFKNQLANVFTKALPLRPIGIILSKLGLVDIF